MINNKNDFEMKNSKILECHGRIPSLYVCIVVFLQSGYIRYLMLILVDIC